MADGYARASGRLGVCMAIDGPGTVNAIPMLASAQADNSSVLLIAGRIPQGFECMGAIQDTSQSGINTVDMLKPVCHKSLSIHHKETLSRYFKEAIRSISGFKKGTAYLSIAKEILLEEAIEKPQKVIKNYHTASYVDKKALKDFSENDLKISPKIAIIIGNRNSSKEFYETLINFSTTYDIPVATTISSKGLFPEDHPNFLGIFGYSGHKRAHDVFLSDHIDLVILLGFDVTQWTTLAWHEGFINQKKLVQVDKDPTYLEKNLKLHAGIIGDEVAFLQTLDQQESDALSLFKNERKKWLSTLQTISLIDQDITIHPNPKKIHPAEIVQIARLCLPKNTIAVADAGVHRSYATHYWKNFGYNEFFAATSFAPMGWAVPASIGIGVARKNQPLVVFSGDGCMLMSGLEIQTAVKLRLNLTILIFNNGYYGASYFNNVNNEPYLTQISQNNWSLIAKGLGAQGFQIYQKTDLENVLNECAITPGVKVIDIICNHEVRAPFPLYAQTLKTRAFM